MRTFLVILSICAIFSTTGCVSFSNLEKSATLAHNSQDAIIVLGAKPRFRVAIAPGEIIEGKVKIGAMAAINTYPEEGYIVGRVSAAMFPNEYHIQLILPEGISGGAFGQAYGPCGDDQVLSFHAPAGKVIYVGDVEYSQESGRLAIKYSDDIDRARDFMKRHYPALANQLEFPGLQTKPIVHVNCGARVTIPVYVRTR